MKVPAILKLRRLGVLYRGVTVAWYFTETSFPYEGFGFGGRRRTTTSILATLK
jgi:hypothetical protein